jgi:hypothetical protein
MADPQAAGAIEQQLMDPVAAKRGTDRELQAAAVRRIAQEPFVHPEPQHPIPIFGNRADADRCLVNVDGNGVEAGFIAIEPPDPRVRAGPDPSLAILEQHIDAIGQRIRPHRVDAPRR